MKRGKARAPSPQATAQPVSGLTRTYGVVFIIAIAIAIVYGQTIHHDFVNYDDPDYVSGNPVVSSGITPAGIVWAFATVHVANWIPLTWISHMADAAMFGSWSGGHHLTNAILHLANSLLLFFVLERMTRGFWQSAAVAVIFCRSSAACGVGCVDL